MKELIELLNEIKPDVDYSEEKNLIDDGILDSLDVVSLVSEINDRFDVEIGLDDLTPENFDSAEAIYTLIERLKG